MKRIMLIIISVVMIFTACKESSPEQIDNEENFNGITFGMTKEEIITILSKNSDYEDEYGIEFKNQIFLNVTTDSVFYYFDENGTMDSIFAFYMYLDESAKEQMPIDLDHIKEELSKYYPEYPEKTRTYTYENGEALSLHTENRHISLRIYDHSFSVTITTKDESE